MGWMAANVAMNLLVTKVTVLELDSDVVELFEQSGRLESLSESAQRKITIINANSMAWRPAATGVVNFLYADIWFKLSDTSSIESSQANASQHSGREDLLPGTRNRYPLCG